MMRWMRDTFEFDQPYKQTENKMQVTEKIWSNKYDQACVTVGILRQVMHCKQKKRRLPTWDLPLSNSMNGTARCSLTLKNIKMCLKYEKII